MKIKRLCDKCREKVKELKRIGYSPSVHNSMVSSFVGVILCNLCGEELPKKGRRRSGCGLCVKETEEAKEVIKSFISDLLAKEKKKYSEQDSRVLALMLTNKDKICEARVAKEREEAKIEAYDEFFLAIDKEFENFTIDEAMGKILLKLKLALKSEEK